MDYPSATADTLTQVADATFVIWSNGRDFNTSWKEWWPEHARQ